MPVQRQDYKPNCFAVTKTINVKLDMFTRRKEKDEIQGQNCDKLFRKNLKFRNIYFALIPIVLGFAA